MTKTLAKMESDLKTHDKVKTHKRTFFKLLSQLLYRPSSPIVLRNVVLVRWLVGGGGGGPLCPLLAFNYPFENKQGCPRSPAFKRL